MGDGIQAAKAGILEVGDIFVVNKADRDGAQAVVRELRGMLALTPSAAGGLAARRSSPRVAVDGQGLDRAARGRRPLRRARRQAPGPGNVAVGSGLEREVAALALARLRAELMLDNRADSTTLARAVRDGELDPYTAADRSCSPPGAERRRAAGVDGRGPTAGKRDAAASVR